MNVKNKDNTKDRPTEKDLDALSTLEAVLCERVRRDEASTGKSDKATDTLWDHLLRVANLAERVGRAQGVSPMACRLAGLFHDSGKFSSGVYHQGETPEEDLSVGVLRELGESHGLEPALVETVSDAILQLYRDDPEPTDLAQVLFDADNLDKLGPLGIANYFVKAGLRGRGVSQKLLYRLTMELTYARHAPDCLLTPFGRELAGRRAPATVRFLHDLLETLRQDGLYDFRIEEVEFNGLILDVVEPLACECGGELKRRIWKVPGIKCSEIHMSHSCAECEASNEIRFCRPRLSQPNEA